MIKPSSQVKDGIAVAFLCARHAGLLVKCIPNRQHSFHMRMLTEIHDFSKLLGNLSLTIWSRIPCRIYQRAFSNRPWHPWGRPWENCPRETWGCCSSSASAKEKRGLLDTHVFFFFFSFFVFVLFCFQDKKQTDFCARSWTKDSILFSRLFFLLVLHFAVSFSLALKNNWLTRRKIARMLPTSCTQVMRVGKQWKMSKLFWLTHQIFHERW